MRPSTILFVTGTLDIALVLATLRCLSSVPELQDGRHACREANIEQIWWRFGLALQLEDEFNMTGRSPARNMSDAQSTITATRIPIEGRWGSIQQAAGHDAGAAFAATVSGQRRSQPPLLGHWARLFNRLVGTRPTYDALVV